MFQVYVMQQGPLRLQSLVVSLVCEETARSETKCVYRQVLLEETNLTVGRDQPFQWRGKVEPPARAMHSFKTKHNEVHWHLEVRGKLTDGDSQGRARFPCPTAHDFAADVACWIRIPASGREKMAEKEPNQAPCPGCSGQRIRATRSAGCGVGDVCHRPDALGGGNISSHPGKLRTTLLRWLCRRSAIHTQYRTLSRALLANFPSQFLGTPLAINQHWHGPTDYPYNPRKEYPCPVYLRPAITRPRPSPAGVPN
jgi:hypothetical protein